MKIKVRKNLKKIIVFLIIVLLTTGCTQQLKDKNNKIVKNESTGQTLTKNILCKPDNKKTISIYKKNNINVNKLPECKDFKITTGKYEGLWTSIFVKPLAYILIQIAKFTKNYGLSVILVSLIIRLIAFPLTKKAALQSEIMKKAQPELNKIQKKYENKKDQESVIKQNQEMMAIYKKCGINPMAGCLFAFIQLPIFIAFFEALQRTPVIFEDKFLGLHLGTTPVVGISSSTFYSYLILMIIIGITTYLSFKMNTSASMTDPSMKTMPIMMSGMIIITALFMPSGLGIYWVTSNIFTIIQNILVKGSKEINAKK